MAPVSLTGSGTIARVLTIDRTAVQAPENALPVISTKILGVFLFAAGSNGSAMAVASEKFGVAASTTSGT